MADTGYIIVRHQTRTPGEHIGTPSKPNDPSMNGGNS